MFTYHREFWSGRKDRRKSHREAQEDSNTNAHWTSLTRGIIWNELSLDFANIWEITNSLHFTRVSRVLMSCHIGWALSLTCSSPSSSQRANPTLSISTQAKCYSGPVIPRSDLSTKTLKCNSGTIYTCNEHDDTNYKQLYFHHGYN